MAVIQDYIDRLVESLQRALSPKTSHGFVSASAHTQARLMVHEKNGDKAALMKFKFNLPRNFVHLM